MARPDPDDLRRMRASNELAVEILTLLRARTDDAVVALGAAETVFVNVAAMATTPGSDEEAVQYVACRLRTGLARMRERFAGTTSHSLN